MNSIIMHFYVPMIILHITQSIMLMIISWGDHRVDEELEGGITIYNVTATYLYMFSFKSLASLICLNIIFTAWRFYYILHISCGFS